MREAGTGANGPRTARPLCRSLEAARSHPVDVLALPKRAACRDETDLWEESGPLPQRDIGDGILQPIDEACQRQLQFASCVFDAGLRTGETFRLQIRVRSRRIEPRTKGTEQLVQRRHSPA